jgi:tRNA threonylcarbamoyladenosine biosynthesis protein TsaB
MKIVALEFSCELRSAAVLAEPKEPVQASESEPRQKGPLAMINAALAGAGLEREDIEVVAVGLGPGSYTGIRAAIALAQGWELARGVRLLGISSVEVLVAQAQAEGARGELGVLVDAQRGEYYLSRYQLGALEVAMLEPLRLVGREELSSLKNAGLRLIGPDAASVAAGADLTIPGAGRLARLAAGREGFVDGGKLEPIYLRETSFVKAPPPRWIPGIEL